MNRLKKALDEVRQDTQKVDDAEIFDLFTTKQKLGCDDVEKFATEKGYDKKDVMVVVYKFAKKFVDFMNDGLWKKIKDASTIDKAELAKGIKIEKEHSKDEDIAEKIALDHLSEYPGYYQALAAMEKELGKGE